MAFTTMAGFGYLVYLTKMESPAAKRSYPYNGLEAELGGSADTPKVSRQLRLVCWGRKPGADCGYHPFLVCFGFEQGIAESIEEDA